MLATHCLGACGRCGLGMVLALFVCTKCARPLIARVPVTTGEYVLLTNMYEPFTLKDTLLRQADCAALRSTCCTSPSMPCYGSPVALEYVLLMTLECEVHTTEYVWPSWSTGCSS